MTNEEKPDLFDNNVREDQVVEAKFKLIEYNITYDLDGGVADNPTKYNIESNDITLNNPEKEGKSISQIHIFLIIIQKKKVLLKIIQNYFLY